MNPYGTQTYVEGAGPSDRPTLTQTFSPEQQAMYEQSNRAKGLLSGLGAQGAESLQGVVGTPIDYGALPAAPSGDATSRDAVVNAMMSRVDEDVNRQKDQANSDLVAAGIRPGTKAYNDRMSLIERGRTDARQQAILAGGQEQTRQFGLQTQQRKDAIAEYLSKRQSPLNEIAALLSGGQVTNPFAVPGYAQNAQIAAAPVFQAQNLLGQYGTDVYNVKAQQAANLQSGLFGLGKAGIMGGM